MEVRNSGGVRERIIEVADRLLREQGPAAVTTRSVAHAAGVQAPAIYRLFGDKDGLLEAVAEHAVAEFARSKRAQVERAAEDGVDPLDDLRTGWDLQLEFGLANPSLFALLTVPGRAQRSAAAVAAEDVLRARVRRVAATGHLRVGEDRAVELIRAAGSGAVIAILSRPDGDRDRGIADDIYEAVLDRILIGVSEPGVATPVATAVALRAQAHDLAPLSDGERALLIEWLDRVIAEA